ncbi:MAG TPA: cupin domain-containing protein [Candidatus Dormibacteraeota bacterium]
MKGLRRVTPGDASADTLQTSGMVRRAGVSASTVGASKIWMGETHMAPGTVSGAHHHGENETGIYVVAGNPVFIYLADGVEERIETHPGDYVYVPPFVPHIESNEHGADEAVVIIARSSQKAIVENLSSLDA